MFPVSNSANTAPITIRNGTIQNFNVGINVGPALNGGPLNGYFSNIRISNIFFFSDGEGVNFYKTNSSTVSYCVFTNVSIGIGDSQSQGGNTYVNDEFKGTISGQFAGLSFTGLGIGGNTPYTIGYCHFEAPTN